MSDCGCNNFPSSLGNVSFGASVGIGTETPLTKLQVLGSQGATDPIGSGLVGNGILLTNADTTSGNYTGIEFDSPDDSHRLAGIYALRDGSSNPASLVFATNGGGGFAERIRIDSSGRLGIGTPTPQSGLGVAGGAAIGTAYAGSDPAPTNGLIVEGHVGIGAPIPAYPLDVNGIVNAGGGVNVGSVPAIDSSGVAHSAYYAA